MVGGSPMTFALIGFLIVLQMKRRDLPRFQLGTWYGNYIVGYATLGNLPFFSKDGSTLFVHTIGLLIGILSGVFLIKKVYDIES